MMMGWMMEFVLEERFQCLLTPYCSNSRSVNVFSNYQLMPHHFTKKIIFKFFFYWSYFVQTKLLVSGHLKVAVSFSSLFQLPSWKHIHPIFSSHVKHETSKSHLDPWNLSNCPEEPIDLDTFLLTILYRWFMVYASKKCRGVGQY